MGDNYFRRQFQLVVLLFIIGGAHSQTCQSDQCTLNDTFLEANIIRFPTDTCFNVSERVNFTCEEGGSIGGPPYNLCQNNNTWMFEFDSYCENVKPCIPPNITNGKVSPGKNSNGDDGYYPFESIEYSCDDGYRISGSNIAFCQLGGNWSTSEPNCLVACGGYPMVKNGNYSSKQSNFVVGENVQFECFEGFETTDETILTCQSDRKWSNEVPQCDDKDECSSGSHDCKTMDNEVCRNTFGSFVCECAPGYSRNANDSCIDDVSLECDTDSFTVTINLARVGDIEASMIALMGDQTCRAEQINDTLVIESGLGECGTSVSVSDDYVDYVNIIIDADDANISPPDKILIPVTCRYSRRDNVNPHSLVNDFKVVKHVSRMVAARFDFLVYQDDKYLLPLLNEETLLDFSRPIYLEIKAEYDGEVKAGAEQCWASDKDGDNRIQLIFDNCATDESLVTVLDSSNPANFRFSVWELSEISGVSKGLIHCDAIACDPYNSDSICSSDCGSLNRRKRSLNGFLHATRLSVV